MLTVYGKFHSNICTFRAHQICWTALETPLLTSRDFPNNVMFTLKQNVIFFDMLQFHGGRFPGTPNLKGLKCLWVFDLLSCITAYDLLQALHHVGHVETRLLDFGNHVPFQLSNFSNPTMSRRKPFTIRYAYSIRKTPFKYSCLSNIPKFLAILERPLLNLFLEIGINKLQDLKGVWLGVLRPSLKVVTTLGGWVAISRGLRAH